MESSKAEKEYIERKAALRANCYFCSAHLKDDSPCDEKCADYMKFMEIPAADVRSVVVCADCKWFQINMRQDGYLPEGVPEWECRHWCGPCDPTDFCSYGAKMEG